MSQRALTLLVASALVTGCTDGRRPGGGGTGDGGGGMTGVDAGPRSRLDASGQPPSSGQCSKIDFIFVVDDSGSMDEEQTNLAQNFPRFVEAVESFRTDDGFPLDYRLAVTTTGKDFTTTIEIVNAPVALPPMSTMESGPNGAFIEDTSCGMTRPWVAYGDPDVSSTFSCAAAVGTGGASIEMPLLMMENAVTTRVADGTNLGFLREDALLAVVILTDEDDCSRLGDSMTMTVDFANLSGATDACDESDPEVLPTSRFITAMDGVTGDRGRWAVAVIAGPGPGTCSSAFGDAQEASRLRRFVGEVGDNAVFSSICEGDLAGALTTALETFDTACQTFPPLI